jgi:hypothetical protein
VRFYGTRRFVIECRPSMTPSVDQRSEILSHVRYEIEHCFFVPAHNQNDGHVRESVYLAMLIHARNLLDFFEPTERWQDDVLCSDFGFPPAVVPIDPKERKRFNKDLLHLTYSRLRHTPDTKPWPVLAILQPLACLFIHI